LAQKKFKLEYRLNVATHDGQIAFDVIELSDAWEQSPFFESDLLKQSQARFVVGEDETNHRPDLKGGRVRDCFAE
jgi:hypothetical protein